MTPFTFQKSSKRYLQKLPPPSESLPLGVKDTVKLWCKIFCNTLHQLLTKVNLTVHFFPTEKVFTVGLSPSKKVLFCVSDSPSKMMKNDFYFILKALFVLKIFKFLSLLFGHVEKCLD